MFVIYMYNNDPLMRVKSAKYSEDQFLECKEFIPKEEENLFETSVIKELKRKEEIRLK